MIDPMSNRVPPHNREVEESLLCSLILDNQVFDDVAGVISPGDFYTPALQKIYTAISTLLTKGRQPVDLPILASYLQDQGELENVGGAPYLASLVNDIPIASNAQRYAQIIAGKAALRQLIEKSHRIISECFECSEPPDEIIDRAQAEITGIQVGGLAECFVKMDQLTLETADRLEAARKGRNDQGIKTGIYELDTLTGGFWGSKLIIVGARPRIGKTAFMCNIARNMAKVGHMVGIFSIEMDRGEIDDRFLAAESGVNSLRFNYLRGNDPQTLADWNRITEAMCRKSEWPIIVDDTGGLPILELCRRARRMKKAGVKIIFIDQFSKIRGDRSRSKFEEATGIVECLGDLKKELRMPVVLLAQINRKLEDRRIKKPTLADLKNTGQLEEEADIALLLHREAEYRPTPENRAKAVLSIAKHRGGPCKDIELLWDAKRTMFKNPHPRC